MKNDVLARVSRLPKLSLPELKALWRELYETAPPRATRTFLTRRLAYRIQELAFGVDPDIERRIAAHAKEGLGGKRQKQGKGYVRPMVGTRLVREYKNVEYQVTVLEEGYEYQGCEYKSLSQIAALITGTSWSGPAFFGLNKRVGESR